MAPVNLEVKVSLELLRSLERQGLEPGNVQEIGQLPYTGKWPAREVISISFALFPQHKELKNLLLRDL